jgi:hypothetical protein
MANAKQIEKELIEWHNAQEDKNEDYFEETEYFSEAWGTSDYSIYEYLYPLGRSKKPTIEIPSGNVQIFRETGGSDEGSRRSVILTVGEQYFEIEGYYTSWEGDNWDDATLHEVEPKEVKVIRFFPKEG